MDKANLTRIRDNQRRSRARRKEYVAGLEKRLRRCELQGVEASLEIQQAARKVAEENRVLRHLLHRQGLDDGRINSFLRSGTMAHLDLAAQTRDSGPGAVTRLETLMKPRQPPRLHFESTYPPIDSAPNDTMMSGNGGTSFAISTPDVVCNALDLGDEGPFPEVWAHASKNAPHSLHGLPETLQHLSGIDASHQAPLFHTNEDAFATKVLDKSAMLANTMCQAHAGNVYGHAGNLIKFEPLNVQGLR